MGGFWAVQKGAVEFVARRRRHCLDACAFYASVLRARAVHR